MKKSAFVCFALVAMTSCTSIFQQKISKLDFIAECMKFEKVTLNTETKVTIDTETETEDGSSKKENKEFYIFLKKDAQGKYQTDVMPKDTLESLGVVITYLALQMPFIDDKTTFFNIEGLEYYKMPYQVKSTKEDTLFNFNWDRNGVPTSYESSETKLGAKVTTKCKYEAKGDKVQVNKDEWGN
ncbi:MAG: hypothetical protein MJ239_05380 [Bacilli bacterium]|nr:hypothetical protein [Bacilli bacterium]